jgi:DNA helicase HerA-like ATPase
MKKMIGIVTEVIDDKHLLFRCNASFAIQLNKIIGINIENNIYLLGKIQEVEVNYFLRDEEEYFTSLSVDNKLIDLSSGTRKPKYAHKAQARYLGIYEYDQEIGGFRETTNSIDTFTPSIFQEIFEFDFEEIVEIYGLKQVSSKTSIKLGEFLYPNYFSRAELSEVRVPLNAFNAHTLISGVTGAGKSRLTALITNQLKEGKEVEIIDPHKEYPYLVGEKAKFISGNSKKIEKYLQETLNDFQHLQFNEETFKTIIIDEAHTLLKEEKGKNLLSAILRTSRKFGYAMIFISQNQGDIPEEIVSQFQNYFSFREENNENLKYLPDQTCICKLRKGKVAFPLRVENVDIIK